MTLLRPHCRCRVRRFCLVYGAQILFRLEHPRIHDTRKNTGRACVSRGEDLGRETLVLIPITSCSPHTIFLKTKGGDATILEHNDSASRLATVCSDHQRIFPARPIRSHHKSVWSRRGHQKELLS
jgi:hypothetical protein